MNTRLPPLFLAPHLLQTPNAYYFAKCNRPSSPRLFQTFPPARASVHSPTHYETLGLSPSASQSDVKAKFYDLSKQHHPDHNPADPDASTRFVAISVAYATIGNPEKRKQYDRDVISPLQGSSPAGGGGAAHQPYQGSGHAGGRKASGLSRRRTQFRGPPPSFYRSGGWGKHSAKKPDHAAGPESEAGTAHGSAGHGGRGFANGSADAQRDYPFAATDLNDVPHFDRDGHYRVQSTVEEQLRQGRAQRRQAQTRQRQTQMYGLGFGRYEGQAENQFGSFLVVSAIVVISASGSLFMMSGFDSRKGNKGKQ